MRLSAGEKYEIIQTVTRSEIGVKPTLDSFGIARSTFYKWYQSYLKHGYDGLRATTRGSHRQWNSIPEEQKDLVVEIALEHSELSSRELAYKITDEQDVFISESSVYRILKQRDLIPAIIFLFQQLTSSRIKQLSYIKCGRQISLISRLLAGAGTI